MTTEKRGLEYVKEQVEKVYLLNDPYICKVVVASIISHRLPSDPVWLFIVSPSGGCKTEFINAVSKVKSVHPVSTLTSHTFISGAKQAGGKEASLLLRMQSGIITFEDFTTLLNEHRDELSAIMGQLRSIYGGAFTKDFGTGETIDWVGKITILAGATYAIHTLRRMYSAMGERFLIYALVQPDRIEAARRTMVNQESGQMKEMRAHINETFRHYSDEEIVIPEKMPSITDELRQELLDLAELATRARSTVERDWHSATKDILEAHPPEMPTRFAGQLQIMAQALMVINQHEGHDGLLEEDKHILYKMTLDSITKTNRMAMQELAKYEVIETAGLATKMAFPTTTVRRWLEDLNALEIIDRLKGGGSKGDRWKMKPKYRTIMQKFDNVKELAIDLTEVSAERDFMDEEDIAGDAERDARAYQEENPDLISDVEAVFGDITKPLI